MRTLIIAVCAYIALLVILPIALKASGALAASWWLVTAFAWGPFVLSALAVAFALAVYYAYNLKRDDDQDVAH